MRLLIFAFAALSLPYSAALAADNPAADLAKADQTLNAAFKQIEHRLSDDANGKQRLIKAQRAWIAFRDAECTFQSSGDDGGSAAPMIIASCRTNLTVERTKQLKAYLNCQEGDLSCPVPSE
jgi:uncharacterized protein YecT (DUF1311 family)